MYGGRISSILLNIPGDEPALMTTLGGIAVVGFVLPMLIGGAIRRRMAVRRAGEGAAEGAGPD